MQETVIRRLENVDIGEPKAHAGLTAFPLLAPKTTEPDYLTLDEALHAGTLSITETSESGSVPTIRLLNKGHLPVLIVDGQELVGAWSARCHRRT